MGFSCAGMARNYGKFVAAGGGGSGVFYYAPERLPVSAIMYPGNAGISEYFGGFPAMDAGVAAEDHRSAQIPDPSNVHLDTIYGDIEGTGDVSLIEFIGCPKIDDDTALP